MFQVFLFLTFSSIRFLATFLEFCMISLFGKSLERSETVEPSEMKRLGIPFTLKNKENDFNHLTERFKVLELPPIIQYSWTTQISLVSCRDRVVHFEMPISEKKNKKKTYSCECFLVITALKQHLRKCCLKKVPHMLWLSRTELKAAVTTGWYFANAAVLIKHSTVGIFGG